jgi:hypothetical protein
MFSDAAEIRFMNSSVYKKPQCNKNVHTGTLVKILGAMHMLMSSWNKSLQAYGISTRQMSCGVKMLEHIEVVLSSALVIHVRMACKLSYLGVVASLALINVFLHISLAHESTFVANMDLECIGLIKQALFQEIGGTVRDDAIAFHFSEP